MTPRAKTLLDQRLREGLEKIQQFYKVGLECNRYELLSDIRHDIDLLVKRLGISPKTPVDVQIEDGEVLIRFGSFPNRN